MIVCQSTVSRTKSQLLSSLKRPSTNKSTGCLSLDLVSSAIFLLKTPSSPRKAVAARLVNRFQLSKRFKKLKTLLPCMHSSTSARKSQHLEAAREPLQDHKSLLRMLGSRQRKIALMAVSPWLRLFVQAITASQLVLLWLLPPPRALPFVSVSLVSASAWASVSLSTISN